MKPLPLVILATLAIASVIRAQDESVAPPQEAINDSEITPTTARILGDIPDGTPPPPAPPKPPLAMPAEDILQSSTHEQGGRTITIRKIKPIALPPPPAPVESISTEVDAEFSERLDEYRAAHPSLDLLFIGATVFRSKDSPPRTLVRCWPQPRGESITFWSSADFALIAGGIQTFVDSASNTHAILMGWGVVDLDKMSDLRTSQGLEYDAPEMPDFPEGKATFQIVGKQPAAEDLIPIQSLHELYNSNHTRLESAYQGRERARLEREAELKANPPRPKDLTLNFWRTERPAAAKGGAK